MSIEKWPSSLRGRGPFFCQSRPCHARPDGPALRSRSEEHTSELQSLMRISYAVFCLKKKTYTMENISINSSLQISSNYHLYIFITHNRITTHSNNVIPTPQLNNHQ